MEQVEHLQTEPWRHGFFPLMRRIASTPHVEPVGSAPLPEAECFRIGQRPSLIFAPREVADAEVKNGKLHIRLFGLGMLGVNGPLPIHVTEIAREREEQRQDPTLCNFLDIFHHRSLSLLYRAWASAQSTAGLDQPEQERFSDFVANLTGHTIRHDRTPFLPMHARLSAAPHRVREGRNVDGLRSTLAQYFDVPVQILEYQFHWIALAPSSQCLVGEERMSSYLGAGAILGEQAPDSQYRFRIMLGPLEIDDYQHFTPRGAGLLRLIEWVHVFVSEEFNWDLQLLIKPHSAPPAQIGGPQQLGWSSWMGESPTDLPITGMLFEPEPYLRQLRRDAARRADKSMAKGVADLNIDS